MHNRPNAQTWPHIAVLVIFFIITPASLAQPFSVSGYVEDAETGERLAYANVFNVREKSGTSTNDYGFFRLTVNQGFVKLAASHVGYSPDSVAVRVLRDTSVTISLPPRTQLIGDVQITADRHRVSENVLILTPEEIAALPALGGESDVLKVIQTLPGVRSGSEGTTGLHVRGGTPDQNLILLDGVPIYHAAHLFGFVSLFNPDAVQSVRVIKGGFPARYGSRLSAVVDVDTKEGSLNHMSARVGLSPIAARFMIEGPLVTKRASYALSARRTYLDALASMILPEGAIDMRAYFYDFNGKINYILSSKSRIYASVYGGRDRYYRHSSERIEGADEGAREGIGWTNSLATLRFTRVLSPRVFFELAAHTSDYKLNVYDFEQSVRNGVSEFAGLQYQSGIRDHGVSGELDIFANEDHSIRAGIQLTHHQFRPGTAHYAGADSALGAPTIHYALEGAAYLEDEISVLRRWNATVGLRASGFRTGGRSYGSFEPRILVSFSLTETSTVSTSFSIMQQYVHLLTSSAVGMPTDLWLPTTETVRPERASQATLGYTFRSPQMEARIEGSYKRVDGLLEYREGASFAGSEQDWQKKITQGAGRYIGLEVSVSRRFAHTTATVAYTLSRSTRLFSEIDGGKRFLFRYDRPHDAAITLTHKLSDRRNVTAFWTYGSGDAVTLPRAWYHDPVSRPGGRVFAFFGSRGNYRTPAYHRLDFVYNITYKWSRADAVLGLGMYNVYGRANPFYMSVDTYPANQFGSLSEVPPLSLKKVSVFRFIPVLSLGVTL